MKTTLLFILMAALAMSLAGPTAPAFSGPLRISAPNYILMETSNGQILAEQSSTQKAYPASTTKLLTAYVVLSKVDLQSRVVVPKEARVGGSHIFLTPGSYLSVEDALYALLLSSANDAAVALAHTVSGSVEAFAQEMNNMAKSLGAKSSNFTNPHGLPDVNHYTTAFDLALVTRAVLKHPVLAKMVSSQTREISIFGDVNRTEQLTNHNRMLWWYEGCTGAKTGFTQQSRHCIVASARRNGRELIAVVLGASSSSAMWRDAANLLDYGFSAFTPREIIKKGQRVAEATVLGGKTTVEGVAAESFSILESDSYPEVTVKAIVQDGLRAPLKAGQKIGMIIISQSEHQLGQVDVLAAHDVPYKYPLGIPPRYYALLAGIFLPMLALYLTRRGQRRLAERAALSRPGISRRYNRMARRDWRSLRRQR